MLKKWKLKYQKIKENLQFETNCPFSLFLYIYNPFHITYKIYSPFCLGRPNVSLVVLKDLQPSRTEKKKSACVGYSTKKRGGLAIFTEKKTAGLVML
jgi:hypothetical protein